MRLVSSEVYQCSLLGSSFRPVAFLTALNSRAPSALASAYFRRSKGIVDIA